MKITFLGTGSSIPSPKKENQLVRSYAAIYVELEHDSLLFDIGPGTMSKLQQYGVSIRNNPTHLFLSHFHLDHCLDYIALVKARGLFKKYEGTTDVLNVYGPVELKAFTNDLFSGVKKWDYMRTELEADSVISLQETMNGLVVEKDNWKVTCMPVNHYNGVAYRLDVGDKSFVYSGDMVYDENLAILGKDADVVAVECSYPDRDSLKGAHLCPEDIGKLAKLGNFQQTVITHMYPGCEGREDEMLATIHNLSGTKAIAAYDSLSIDMWR